MFASNYNDPFDSNNGQQIVQKPFDIINDFSFFNFPSPLIFPYDQLGLDQENDNIVCNQQNDQQVPLRSVDDHIVESDSTMIINMANSNKIDMKNGSSSAEDCNKKKKKKSNNITNHRKTTRKISPKKDRHSKINAAQGLRGRRIRGRRMTLSLEVAPDFFWLQDMLGYNKASKTVEWLLHQSKPEIVKLERGSRIQMNNYSSVTITIAATSECEVVSSDRVSILNSTKEIIKKTRKGGSHNALAKDLRQKARARARERTIEKICSKGFDGYSNIITVEAKGHLEMSTTRLNSCSLYSSIEEPIVSSSSQREPSGIHDQMMDDVELLGTYWSSTAPYSNILNCLHNPSPIPQQNQFGDFQTMGKPWEGHNNYQNLY